MAEGLTELANWRSRTIMHLAMHDALNAVVPRYARYAPRTAEEPPGEGAAPEAALAAAAGTVLLALHPGARDRLEAAMAAGIAAAPEGPGREAGVALGQAIARAGLARREGDGPTGPMPFTPSTEPGRWRPAPPRCSLGDTAGIGLMRPFVMSHPGEHRPEGPPALDSAAMRRDIEEMRRMGGAVSAERAPEQEEVGRFCQGTLRSWPLVAAPLLLARAGGDAWWTARAMALLDLALFDTNVATWDTKSHSSRWRPIHALREGGFGVAPDPDWTPLLPPPPHPEHLAGHPAPSMAAALVVTALLGGPVPVGYRGLPFTGPATPIGMRRFASPVEAARECGESRIWVGAHFRTTDEHSVRLAEATARRVLETQLLPLA